MASQERDLRGIGGWLFYFCLGQAVWVAFSVYDLVATLAAARGAPSLSDSQSGDIQTAVICDAIIAGVSSVGLILALRKHKWAPDFWAAGTFVLGWVSLVRNVTVSDFSHPNGPPTSEDSASLLRGVLVMVAWFIYWLRSKRVAATYGSNGEFRKWLNRVWLDKAQSTSPP